MKLQPTSAHPAQLQVRDIMQPDIVTVEPSMTLRQLARLLTSMHISGAPVVDAAGEVIGVISMTDLVTATLRPDPAPAREMRRVQVEEAADGDPAAAGAGGRAARQEGEAAQGLGSPEPTVQPPARPAAQEVPVRRPPGEVRDRRWNVWFQDLWEERSVLEGVLLDRAADYLTVEDVMTPLVYVIRETESLTELVDLMDQARIHRVLVTDGESIVGIVTTMDLIRVIPRLLAG